MLVKDIANVNPLSKQKYNNFINYIDTSSVYDGKLLNIQKIHSNYPSRAQRIIGINDILISSVRPNLLHTYFINKNINNGVASSGFIHIRVKDNLINPRFLYYFLTSHNNISLYSAIAESSQTTIPSFNKDVIENLELPDISVSKQLLIVDTVGSLDDKIENNNKIIIKLEELLNLKFKNIYSDALKTGITINLNDIVNLKTGKKDANAANENGIYPFFTCSEKESNIDVYSFNQEAILIAGNGNMSVKYFNGKFDAYQRTYVISSSKYFYYLYLYYKNFIGNISVGAKGTVIKFLTKSMLLDIDLPILDNITMQRFESDIQKILNYELRLSEENKKLNLLKEKYLKRFF